MEKAVISFKFVPCQTQTVTLFISVYRFSYIFIWFWLPGIILSFCFLFVLKHRVCLSNKIPQETVYCRHLHSSGYLSLLMVTARSSPCCLCWTWTVTSPHLRPIYPSAKSASAYCSILLNLVSPLRHQCFYRRRKSYKWRQKISSLFLLHLSWSFSLAPPTHKKWL